MSNSKSSEPPELPEPLPVPVYDNHTHLTDYFSDTMHFSTSESLDRGQKVGVKGIVQVGFDIQTSQQSAQLADSDHRVLAAVALHPNEAPLIKKDSYQYDEALSILDDLASYQRVRAIGETGLDYFRTNESGQKAQKDSFRDHLELAYKHNIAVQIHDRDAHESVVSVLQECKKNNMLPEKVVFHCFSGDEKLAKICNEQGWYMSFSGTVTFKNAKNVQDAAKIADSNLILSETDSPFLTSHPYRGRVNSSYMVPFVVRQLAEIREENLEKVCENISENTENVYGSW